jgi:multidrug efflux pump subunit AcrA (membrane-fusion protein)
MGILSACEQNTFVQPPPPKVDVAVAVQGSFTRYLEATGNTAPVKSVDLVARVQGFLQTIEYKDGASVKEGAPNRIQGAAPTVKEGAPLFHDRARNLIS